MLLGLVAFVFYVVGAGAKSWMVANVAGSTVECSISQCCVNGYCSSCK